MLEMLDVWLTLFGSLATPFGLMLLLKKRFGDRVAQRFGIFSSSLAIFFAAVFSYVNYTGIDRYSRTECALKYPNDPMFAESYCPGSPRLSTGGAPFNIHVLSASLILALSSLMVPEILARVKTRFRIGPSRTVFFYYWEYLFAIPAALGYLAVQHYWPHRPVYYRVLVSMAFVLPFFVPFAYVFGPRSLSFLPLRILASYCVSWITLIGFTFFSAYGAFSIFRFGKPID